MNRIRYNQTREEELTRSFEDIIIINPTNQININENSP